MSKLPALTGEKLQGVLPAAVSRECKESTISQTMHYATTAWPSKGILKRRGSLKQKVLREAPTPAIWEPTKDFDISTPAQPPNVASLPLKGILKKPAKREYGYYSSQNNSDSAQKPQAQLCPSARPTGRAS